MSLAPAATGGPTLTTAAAGINGLPVLHFDPAQSNYLLGDFPETYTGTQLTVFFAGRLRTSGSNVANGYPGVVDLPSNLSTQDWNNTYAVNALTQRQTSGNLATEYNTANQSLAIGDNAPIVADAVYNGSTGQLFVNGQAGGTLHRERHAYRHRSLSALSPALFRERVECFFCPSPCRIPAGL